VHLIVPFASFASDAGRDALARLETPALDALLAGWREAGRDDGDETSAQAPHERALARALGWRVAHDGSAPLPWGARAARADGIDVGTAAWALVTPVHWRVGSDAVHLADPRSLALDEAASRALFDALRPLFDGAGFGFAWGAPLRWYASHPDFATLVTASPERAVGRNVDRWLPAQAQARAVRRLQSEAQMLLHAHPLNAARETVGLPAVNSFWLSGCGVFQAERASGPVQVDDRLATPALADDAAGWAAAWRALDATLLPTRPLEALTLCGERSALTFERVERRLWQRASGLFAPRRRARDSLAQL
jgi:hypothetical protein